MVPRLNRRPMRGNAVLLRKLRGERVSIIDEPAPMLQRAFAAIVIATMFATSAYVSVM